jgi:hypothetical protein
VTSWTLADLLPGGAALPNTSRPIG